MDRIDNYCRYTVTIGNIWCPRVTMSSDSRPLSVLRYVKPVAGVGLDSQEFNPEVVVPQIADAALKERADMLDQIQQVSLS